MWTFLRPDATMVLRDKKALQRIPKFKELKGHKVSEDYDENLSGYRVILCVFPNRRTEAKYRDQTECAFAKLL